ncbi:MAG: hypothetical protein ACRDL7_14515, partial [Gaiellaceae bacterium]
KKGLRSRRSRPSALAGSFCWEPRPPKDDGAFFYPRRSAAFAGLHFGVRGAHVRWHSRDLRLQARPAQTGFGSLREALAAIAGEAQAPRRAALGCSNGGVPPLLGRSSRFGTYPRLRPPSR